MQVIRGDYGGKSTVIGYLRLCRVIRRRERALKVTAQKERLYLALAATEEEIVLMRRAAVESVGEEHGEIYEIYLKILKCEPLRIGIFSEIEAGASSEEAIRSVLASGGVAAEGEFSLRHIKDCLELLIKVLEDVKCPDLRDLSGETDCGSYIYVSDGENSGELITLLRKVTRGDEREPVGVVCANAGELRSAVSMELPSLLIAPNHIPDESFDGITAILDCERRRLILDPDLTELEKYSESGRQNEKKLAELSELIDLRSETASGKRIYLFDQRAPATSDTAVIGTPGADRGSLVLTDALPIDISEDGQYELYKKLAEGRTSVTIRLFELPRDSSASSFREESSTSLRGAGLFALFRQIYKTQLKALLRAAHYGNVSVILPSVSRRDELSDFRSIYREAKAELKEVSIPFSELSGVGLELSTPAAMLNADSLCGEATLVLIDLDRLVSLTSAAELHDPLAAEHFKSGIMPALKLCSHAIDTSGLRFAVRGELAADPELTHSLIDCGFSSFFVDPDGLLAVKEQVLSFREDTYK